MLTGCQGALTRSSGLCAWPAHAGVAARSCSTPSIESFTHAGAQVLHDHKRCRTCEPHGAWTAASTWRRLRPPARGGRASWTAPPFGGGVVAPATRRRPPPPPARVPGSFRFCEFVFPPGHPQGAAGGPVSGRCRRQVAMCAGAAHAAGHGCCRCQWAGLQVPPDRHDMHSHRASGHGLPCGRHTLCSTM